MAITPARATGRNVLPTPLTPGTFCVVEHVPNLLCRKSVSASTGRLCSQYNIIKCFYILYFLSISSRFINENETDAFTEVSDVTQKGFIAWTKIKDLLQISLQ